MTQLQIYLVLTAIRSAGMLGALRPGRRLAPSPPAVAERTDDPDPAQGQRPGVRARAGQVDVSEQRGREQGAVFERLDRQPAGDRPPAPGSSARPAPQRGT